MCVYDEIGKKIYSVVFERRRYALMRGKKSKFYDFLEMIKRGRSQFQIFCGATRTRKRQFGGRRKVFFPFFSLLSLFSLSFLVVERFLISLLCVYLRVYNTAFLLNCYKTTT